MNSNMTRLVGFAAAAALLSACGEPASSVSTETAASPAAPVEAVAARQETGETPANLVERDATAGQAAVTIETGKPIFSVAAIPATAHLGLSHVVVTHGDGGVAAYDTSGKKVWELDKPAKLVAHYQRQLIVFRDDEAETSLDRYDINFPAAPELVETSVPSPLAATTIQRTAYASLGPLRIQGTDIILNETLIHVGEPVSAVASAKYFPPVVAGKAIVIATEDGTVTIQSID